MLGIKANGTHILRDSIGTGIIVFALNFLEKLPTGALPATLEIWTALKTSLCVTLTIYAVNKGIQYKQKGEK